MRFLSKLYMLHIVYIPQYKPTNNILCIAFVAEYYFNLQVQLECPTCCDIPCYQWLKASFYMHWSKTNVKHIFITIPVFQNLTTSLQCLPRTAFYSLIYPDITKPDVDLFILTDPSKSNFQQVPVPEPEIIILLWE